MLKAHKIAIARIFDDLIKADRIVDTGEMVYWRNICEKYDIDREIRVQARDISFADAVMTICDSGVKDLKKDLLDDCRSMTVSDGFCASSEALLMITLSTILGEEDKFFGEVISIPRANFNIDIATVLYVENSYDKETNEAIARSYRSLFKELQLAGFHFVYIPRIIEHYKHTDAELFNDILSFLAPTLSEDGLDSVKQSLMKMNTEMFCKDLLCNKCGITELVDTPPSLLIKIGNSQVGDTLYSNYLKIEVDEEILETVREFIDCYSAMLSSDIYVVSSSEERDNQFHFHGFYKQLLEIFLIRRNIRSNILIDPFKNEISFPEIDAKAIGLHRRERALYTLLLCQGEEGINFRAPSGASAMEKHRRYMEKICNRYATIYQMFGGEKEQAPDLSVPVIRRPIFSCLRRSLANLNGLYNPDDYTVTKRSDGSFAVRIEPDKVYVRQLHSDEPIPLHESDIYRRCMRL